MFRAFDALGANLVVSARSSHALSQLILDKPQHRAIALDVTREQDFDEAILQIKTKWQKIDLIVFCAGIYSPMNADNFDLVEAKKILEINFGGLVNYFWQIDDFFSQELIQN